MTTPITVPTARQIFEGFSVTHAAILDGDTRVNDVDLFGIKEANLSPDTGSVQNQGDDATLSDWSWINHVNVGVSGGYISLPVYERLTGTTATGDADELRIPLWQEDAGNQPPWPVLIRMASKDRARHRLWLDIMLYSVQFQPIAFTGPAFKTIMGVNWQGKALMSDVDEVGDALTGMRRAGEIVSTLIA